MRKDAVEALTRTTHALCDMLAKVRDDAPIPHMTWTVSQCVAHLVVSNHLYAHQVAGPGARVAIDQTSALNDWSVGLFAGLDPSSMLEDLRSSTRHFVDVVEAQPSDATFMWWSGARSPVDTAAGILVGERLVHGWDIAQALGTRWTIDPPDADIAMAASVAMMPLLVDDRAAAGMNLVYELKLRGQSAYELRFADGALTTRKDRPASRVDCRISGDPVTMLLVGYGRESQWSAVLRGRMWASGRKPWLAMRLGRVLRAP